MGLQWLATPRYYPKRAVWLVYHAEGSSGVRGSLHKEDSFQRRVAWHVELPDALTLL
jgi:hypothetical protein